LPKTLPVVRFFSMVFALPTKRQNVRRI
jgi:hypothetical protein